MRLAPMRAWEKGAIPSRAQDGQNGRTVGLVGARQGHPPLEVREGQLIHGQPAPQPQPVGLRLKSG